MAVYKATYCYPFLTAYDIRIKNTSNITAPDVKWLTCKIDSSNKQIIGYSIRILDEDNQVIFPSPKVGVKVSPISELMPKTSSYSKNLYYGQGSGNNDDNTKLLLPNQEWKTNSGLNGSYLNIPFFQNINHPVALNNGIKSYNSIYCKIDYHINYILQDLGGDTSINNLKNWQKPDENYIYPGITSNLGFNDDLIIAGSTVLILKDGGDTVPCLYKFNSDLQLVPLTEPYVSNDKIVCITQGKYHNNYYKKDNNGKWSLIDEGSIWTDIQNNPINFSRFGSTCKWDITLYQGDERNINILWHNEESKDFAELSFGDVNIEQWYDIILQEGTVLGSKPSRIQLAFKDNDQVQDEILPRNKDDSEVLLYGTFMQLLDKNKNEKTNRVYVNSYDSTYGHVYPLESDANSLSLNGVERAKFYKHSNNLEYITAGDIVTVAATKTDGNLVWSGDTSTKPNGNIELAGIQDFDGTVGESGDFVLLMYQTHPEENGVYKMESDANSKISVQYDTSGGADPYEFSRYSVGDVRDINGKLSAFCWQYTPPTTTSNPSPVTISVYTRNRYPNITDAKNREKAYKNSNCLTDSLEITSITCTAWTRAGSFDEWGEFIGKILYVETGAVNGGHNFECTADAGGSLLKKPYNNRSDSTYEGSSPLYFVPEKPMVLFSQKLLDYNIKAAGVSSTNLQGKIVIDGIILEEGDYALSLNSEGNKGKLIKIINGKEEIQDIPKDSFPGYFYVQNGQTNGKSVYKITKKITDTSFSFQGEPRTDELSVATVLKNKVDRTYISPYTSLNHNMILKFKDNYIHYNDGTSTYYLKVEEFNKNLWYIKHSPLSSPLESYSIANYKNYIP